MNLKQQIINERVEQTAKLLGLDVDKAFLRFAHSTITGQSMHAFDPDDLVDGGQDKQIDTLSIEQDADTSTLWILQMKNVGSFSSNHLIKMRNGLEWIFRKPRADINGLANIPLKDKIFEYRSLQGNLGPANIRVKVGFVTNGLTNDIGEEFEQEQKTIVDQYDNGTFQSFEFRAWGADELVAQINTLEKRNRKIDASISIRYDANNPSLIKYHAEGLSGLVCTTTAKEIARVVNGDALGSIFDSNIRRFLGTRGAVNSEIIETCTDYKSSYLFWFLNNGLTVVCDRFDAVSDPDAPLVKIENMQIVNGCQTASTLAIAEREGKLSADTRVLLRVYATKDPALVSQIVLTTNNQNKISSRDLRSNDEVQVNMESGFARYRYHYERKSRQFDGVSGVDVARIIPNETVAQSYLAVVLKMPSDARRRKYKVWGELYDQIFGGRIIEPYIVASQVYLRAAAYVHESGLTKSADDLIRRVAKSGVFHLARIASFLWRKTEKWDDLDELTKHVGELDARPTVLDGYLKAGAELLVELIRADQSYASDLDGAIKSGSLDTDITRALHKQPATK